MTFIDGILVERLTSGEAVRYVQAFGVEGLQ